MYCLVLPSVFTLMESTRSAVWTAIMCVVSTSPRSRSTSRAFIHLRLRARSKPSEGGDTQPLDHPFAVSESLTALLRSPHDGITRRTFGVYGPIEYSANPPKRLSRPKRSHLPVMRTES
ncbi:hypothetical protein C8Q76DRAFT_467635 [Earliella scabrosa]|nr:hypothetical protein C8Q76DRAFT_467635 [Earliella scabrosa]